MINDVTRPIPFEEFRRRVLELYRPPMRAKPTYCRMRQVLGLVAELGIRGTDELTTDLVARFLAARPPGENPNQTHTHMAYLRSVCNLAAAEGWCRISPFAVRRRWVRKVTPKQPAVHSRADIARVLDLAARDVDRKQGWARWRARRLHALAATVAYTGMRKNEALTLMAEDLAFETRMILVVARPGGLPKTDASAQPVPMPEALARILAGWVLHVPEALPGPVPGPRPDHLPAYLEGKAGVPEPGAIPEAEGCRWLFPNVYRTGPWTGGSPGYTPLGRLKALGVRAGVPGLTFQSLRHSWATHAEYWGLTDAQIQRVLRHTNTRTQWHYRHAESTNLKAIVGGIDFGEAGEVGGGPDS